jgi:selenocysteine lyase/cysteine desulfurase
LTVAIAIVTNNIIPKINKPNSAIIMSNFTYNAVKEAIKYGCELNPLPIRVIIVDIPFPILSDDPNNVILNSYKATLEDLAKDGDISIALGFIDHIVSLPSMLIPVKEIIQLFRQYGVQEILVDGAHAPGQIQLDNIPSLGCDYYVANMHKWCFAPTSAAFLWCSPYAVSRHSLHHPVVSHSYGKGLWAECAMLGTRDYSAMLSIPAALDYLDHLGGLDDVVRRNSELRDMAVTMLSEAWNTTSFAQPASIRTPSLAMVGCPAIFGDTFEKSEEFRLTLRSKGIVVQKLFPVKGDRLYLRLSIAVYNTTQEFEVLRDTVLQIIAEKYGVDAILN